MIPLLAINATAEMGFVHWFCWLLTLCSATIALVFTFRFSAVMLAADEGDDAMKRIAAAVRAGADAYLRQQYRVVLVFFAVIAILLAGMAFGLGSQSKFVPLVFLSGGFFSGLAGFRGMRVATAASNRTAAAARVSLNQALQVSFRSGAVMGLTVVGLALLDIAVWFLFFAVLLPTLFGIQMTLTELTGTMLCASMGASSQALFARVGGGIFTKAADVGADLVGKVEAGIPEDDPRNPATIADNVGDNVGDVAGMGADLYESFYASILATAALGVSATSALSADVQLNFLMLPMVLGAVGTLVSIVGIHWVRSGEEADQHALLTALNRGINLAALLFLSLAVVVVLLILGLSHWGVAVSVATGLAAGWIIGWWTERSTSDVYRPTRAIAESAQYGPATVIISGMAQGMFSTWVPVLVVAMGTLLAYGFPIGFAFDDPSKIALGLYGIGAAAVGMLSTLGITLATDAYGPIADNAGGNAEMSRQAPEVRKRTDALDSVGNTTAATGKGFAIGSAALTALALLAAYVNEVQQSYHRWANRPEIIQQLETAVNAEIPLTTNIVARKVMTADGNEVITAVLKFKVTMEGQELGYRTVPIADATIRDLVDVLNLNAFNPRYIVGVFLGAMLVYLFSAMTMQAVGRAAGQMVEEVRRQFAAIPGLREGREGVVPDYAACVQISTASAQREMIAPSLLALLAPLVTGLLLGVAGVVGMLTGAVTTGFTIAVMMANAGGAWDNAKKFIESGAHGGKGSIAHKAAVVGDTVGDPFKDTSGPSINILIKLMSTVSVVFAPLIVRFMW